jgi:hypothetical protein
MPLTRVPRSRAPDRMTVLLIGEESGTSCVKDLGYGNNTVPQEFAGERLVCRRVPKPERGTRCTTNPNTMRTQGIPSQPSVSRGRRSNGPEGPASKIRHGACSSRVDDFARHCCPAPGRPYLPLMSRVPD